MTSDESSDPGLLSDTLPAGVRVRDQIIEGFIRALPEGRLYRVQHATTGATGMILEYLPEAWVRRVGENVSVIPGRGPEFRAGMQRFLLRAQQLRVLSHPSLPKVLDLMPSHGTAFAVFPLLSVRTLAEVVELDGGRLPLSQVWPWLNTCCDVAQWLHDQGRIHGGFDPQAVWVLDDDQLLLPPPELEEGYRPPSPWVALEQTVLASSGTPRGPWTDVYGVGALASFMLTGQGPKSSARRTMASSRPPGAGPGWVDSRSAALDPIPGVLKAAIRVSLMPNPKERPQDIGQFRAMLGLAEQMAGQVPPVMDELTGEAAPVVPTADVMNRDAQQALARALQPAAPADAAGGAAKRQAATILREHQGPAAHIPTLVLPAHLPATVAGERPERVSSETRLALAAQPGRPGSDPDADGETTRPAPWTESRDMPDTRPLPLPPSRRPATRRVPYGAREVAVAGVAILGLALTWWVLEPRPLSTERLASASEGAPTAAAGGSTAPAAAPGGTATPGAATAAGGDARSSSHGGGAGAGAIGTAAAGAWGVAAAPAVAAVPPASPPVAPTGGAAPAAAGVPPAAPSGTNTVTAALNPDQLLRDAAPAAGLPAVSSREPAAPPPASTTPVPGPAAAPAQRPSPQRSAQCRQALVEQSLGVPSGSELVARHCR